MKLEFPTWPGQQNFVEKVLAPERCDVLAAAGTGGGKTYGLAIASTCLAFSNPPRVNGMIVSPTYQMMEDAMRPTIEELWDTKDIPYRWIPGSKRYYLPMSGNFILMRSGEYPARLRGKNLAWAAMDEVSYNRNPQAVIQEMYKRCRHPAAEMRRVFAATTPNGFDAVYRWFAEPGRKNTQDTACVQWHTDENEAVLDADPQFVERMQRAFTDDLAKQELGGEFLIVGAGRAYYQFSRKENGISFDYSPHLPIDLCVDFNVDPCGWIIAQGGDGREVERAIGEITVRGEKSTLLAIEVFQERYPMHRNGDNVRIFGDTTGHNRKTTGFSDFGVIEQAMPNAQIFVRSRNPAEKDRRNAVNAMLCNSKGTRRAFVNVDACPNLVIDLEQVQTIPGTSKIDKTRDGERTHWSDAWGYKIFYLNPVHVQNARQLVTRARERGIVPAIDEMADRLADFIDQ